MFHLAQRLNTTLSVGRPCVVLALVDAFANASFGQSVVDVARVSHGLIRLAFWTALARYRQARQGTGHGGFMLVVGGQVHGKRLYGRGIGQADDQLYKSRDSLVHIDFRTVFSEALQGTFGCEAFERQMFADGDPRHSSIEFPARLTNCPANAVGRDSR